MPNGPRKRRRTMVAASVAAAAIVIALAASVVVPGLVSLGRPVPTAVVIETPRPVAALLPAGARRWIGDPGIGRDVWELAGPAHCGNERMTWLHVGTELYFRDPFHDLPDVEIGTFVADTPLPVDAVDTGLMQGGRRLFVTPSASAVYVRVGDKVERWPRSKDDEFGCA